MNTKLLFFLLLFLPALPTALPAQQQKNINNLQKSKENINFDTLAVARIAFNETSYNFGELKEGEKIEHTFTFENTGKSPLILSNVLTTCGCTVTKWTRSPVMAGEKGEIIVKFDSRGKEGQQTKIVTVISNAYNARERLFIRTVVVKK
jgi:Protein of unknown function (DUF1573)